MCLWCMSCVERNNIGTVEEDSANNEQPQAESDLGKAAVERLLKGLWKSC